MLKKIKSFLKNVQDDSLLIVNSLGITKSINVYENIFLYYFVAIVYSRSHQLVARGPHPDRRLVFTDFNGCVMIKYII